MVKKTIPTTIIFDIKYFVKVKRAFVRLNAAPKIKLLAYGIVEESKYFTQKEFNDYISKKYIEKGNALDFFIVNKETGQKKPVRFNIEWPHNSGDKEFIAGRKVYELSEYLKDVGIL